MELKNKRLNIDKALKYGFIKTNKDYFLKTKILDSTFIFEIWITTPNIINTKLTEIETNEIYTLHLSNVTGDFVGKIREEYNSLISDIIEKCFDYDIFKSKITHKVINYIKEKYNDNVEYLWEKFPDNAVARRKDNKKWYLAILTVKKEKFGLTGNDNIEVLDLRAKTEDITKLLNQKNIYPGYHMNKQHWITIILDGSVTPKNIFKMIDNSYKIAKKK